MTQDVDGIIQALRARLGAETDSDLAKRLGIDKSTVSSWRSRKSVPFRFVAILNGASPDFMTTPPVQWMGYEQQAMKLALFRFARLIKHRGLLDYYTLALATLSNEASFFWMFMSRSQKDIAERQGIGASGDLAAMSPQTALALILHEEIADSDAAIRRDLEFMDRHCGKPSRATSPVIEGTAWPEGRS